VDASEDPFDDQCDPFSVSPGNENVKELEGKKQTKPKRKRKTSSPSPTTKRSKDDNPPTSVDVLVKKKYPFKFEWLSKPIRFEREKTFYEGFSKEDVMYNVGDCCSFKASGHKTQHARIISVYETEAFQEENEIWVRCQKFQNQEFSKEVTLTEQFENVKLENVVGKCVILKQKEIQDYESFNKDDCSFFCKELEE